MHSNKLRSLIQEVVQNKSTVNCVHFITDDPLGSYGFHANEMALKLYQLLVLAQQGHKRYPMVAYDGDLQIALNRVKYFSNSIGLHFSRQRDNIIEDLIKGRESTILFTSKYGLRGGATRARLWTCNFRVTERKLHVQAVFGHCQVFPMLLYEIAGVEIVSFWLAKQLGYTSAKISWYFHSITGNGTTDKLIAENRVSTSLQQLPAPEEVFELLRLEGLIRQNKPSMLPIQRAPLSEEISDLLSKLYEHIV